MSTYVMCILFVKIKLLRSCKQGWERGAQPYVCTTCLRMPVRGMLLADASPEAVLVRGTYLNRWRPK